MYPIQTIGEVSGEISGDASGLSPEQVADQVFAGCANRTEVIRYVSAVKFQALVKGAVGGLVVGGLVGFILTKILQDDGRGRRRRAKESDE